MLSLIVAGPTEGLASQLADFKEVTKDMVPQAGMLTLWTHPPDNKEKDQEKLLCQIPAALLGQNFMLSTSVSGGGFFTGFPIDQRVVRWQLLNNQVVLIEPETHFVADDSAEVSDAVKRTYPERIRAALPLLSKSPTGDPLVDLGPLLKSEFADIAWMSIFDVQAVGQGLRINSSLSTWTKKKSFPNNVEIGVALATHPVDPFAPPGSFEKRMVHYSFWMLPESDYKSRLADDRLGYFLTVEQDWTKPASARDLFNRYIDRWDLRKRDPSLALCEPQKPIIFYIEKTVPVRFRRAVRDGILEWNKAFEKIGFLNAIEVRQQEDDNEWRDLDPEDMRYSFFRWIVSGQSFAMGPSRSNPFTGQIYDADIIFDDSLIRVFEKAAEWRLDDEAWAMRESDPGIREFLRGHPEWKRTPFHHRVVDHSHSRTPDRDQLRNAITKRSHHRGHHNCDYFDSRRLHLSVAGIMMRGKSEAQKEQLLYDNIKEVTMHEVGHTLGLRHNFKASSAFSLEQIKTRCAQGQAMFGSVMDYNPIYYAAQDIEGGTYATPTIGPYDYWVIEYGYRPADGSYQHPNEHLSLSEADRLDETKMLQAIASRSSEPKLAYGSDYDASFLGIDPRTVRNDMGQCAISFARAEFEYLDRRIDTILEWAVDDQESWYHLRSAYTSLLFSKALKLDFVGRYIGGQYFSRSHRGDPNASDPFVMVDAKKQREALDFIAGTLYQDDFFSLKSEVLRHLAPSRWSHVGASTSVNVDFPVHNFITWLQGWNLFERLHPDTLRRLHDSELRSEASDKFTVAEYLRTLQRACWTELHEATARKQEQWSDSQPYISDIRRSLQREYLGYLELLIRAKEGDLLSPDLLAMVRHTGRRLSQEIGQVLELLTLDFATEAHLTDSKSRIDRMLAAQLHELD